MYHSTIAARRSAPLLQQTPTGTIKLFQRRDGGVSMFCMGSSVKSPSLTVSVHRSGEGSVAVRDSLMKYVTLNNMWRCCSGHDALGSCLGASQQCKRLALAPLVLPQRRQIWGWVPRDPWCRGELCGTAGDQQFTGDGGNPSWVSRLSHMAPVHPCFPLPSPSSMACRGWTARYRDMCAHRWHARILPHQHFRAGTCPLGSPSIVHHWVLQINCKSVSSSSSLALVALSIVGHWQRREERPWGAGCEPGTARLSPLPGIYSYK